MKFYRVAVDYYQSAIEERFQNTPRNMTLKFISNILNLYLYYCNVKGYIPTYRSTKFCSVKFQTKQMALNIRIIYENRRYIKFTDTTALQIKLFACTVFSFSSYSCKYRSVAACSFVISYLHNSPHFVSFSRAFEYTTW